MWRKLYQNMYDLIIIGAGPAGVMVAKTLISRGMKILLLEKGCSLAKRRDLVNGWFGHGLFALNRLDLNDKLLQNPKIIKEVLKMVQRIANQIKTSQNYYNLSDQAGYDLASYLYDSIYGKADVFFKTEVTKIEKNDSFLIHTKKNKFEGKKCLLSTGRNSLNFISDVCKDFNLDLNDTKFNIGVRVEVPTFKIKNLINDCENIGEDVRQNAFVGEWEESNMLSAFGHSLLNKKSRCSNFMMGFEMDVEEAIRNVKIINVLTGDKLKKERIEDFMEGRTILKHLNGFSLLKEKFKEMENTLPSFIDFAIMYIPEIRLQGLFKVNEDMQSEMPGLFGAGECTNKVSNLTGAMASGIIAAKTILKE